MRIAPYFEDFTLGECFDDVPSITVTEGYTAIHQALFADRMRLALDAHLCEQITGRPGQLANPSLVSNLAIGQSTIPSQRVMGNLFYRGLRFHRPVWVGDTLATTTKVVGLRQNKIREGRAASGMVALEMEVVNQHEETVLLFWRCPMIPCRDPAAETGLSGDFSVMPEEIADSLIVNAVPDWDYAGFRDRFTGGHFASLNVGDRYELEARDTVTLAPELVRLTLNMAMTHTDAGRSVYGKRLVYGGHTIAMAAAQLSRVLPNLISILAWYRCDHTAPVFELDILSTVVSVEGLLATDKAGVAKLRVQVFATRGPEAPEPGDGIQVLDWHLAVLMA